MCLRSGYTSLKLAVDISQSQGPVGGLAQVVHGGIKDHFSRCQGAGLVAAEHIDGAEILNGGQMLNDDMVPRHPDGAPSEGH